jgi:hypothetical protein
MIWAIAPQAKQIPVNTKRLVLLKFVFLTILPALIITASARNVRMRFPVHVGRTTHERACGRSNAVGDLYGFSSMSPLYRGCLMSANARRQFRIVAVTAPTFRQTICLRLRLFEPRNRLVQEPSELIARRLKRLDAGYCGLDLLDDFDKERHGNSLRGCLTGRKGRGGA